MGSIGCWMCKWEKTPPASRTAASAANLAAVRRLVVSILRQTNAERGAKCKQMACAINTNYLLKVLFDRPNRCVSRGVRIGICVTPIWLDWKTYIN